MKPAITLLSLLLSFLLTPASQAGDLISFTLPWDDDATGITDFSDLNHKPAGMYGSLEVDAEGHFSVGGQRIRLLGVNITSASCFPTHADAEAVAARLAKFGMNVVRFHHMDNNWGSLGIIDYSQGNSRNLNPVALERLDYFIAQLKAHGIYTNINLINSRDFKVADGLDAGITAFEWKQRHIFGFWDETFRDLEKEYASNILTHVNPYTGLSYAEDPAIAVVEVNNENGIFQLFFDGDLDNWPAHYNDQVNAGWNMWLKNKYSNTADLLDGWSGESEEFGEQLITNPNFSPLSPWNDELHGTAAATFTSGSFDGREGIKIDVTTASSEGWHVQLNQSSLSLVQDELYTINFWVKADAPTTLSTGVGLAYGSYSVVHSFSGIPATMNWEEKTILFRAGTTDTNLRLNFNGFAEQTGTLYLSDVTIHEGGNLEATLPDGETLEAGNISNNLSSGSYTENRSLDWTRYLSYIATHYWTDMRDHIRVTLGFNGLINGSTIMNSPPNIQGVFDFIDTHAYWRHPRWTGENSWDPVEWEVDQDSMVNFLDNNIADLSSQAVKGYPHTVSEYQHAYPNIYASEGPLLIGAYSAMHDWDGIYFFDYAEGDNGWDQGFFNSYFSINHHPTSMANILIAANLFRRADVSASTEELILNFSPEREVAAITNGGRPWNVGDGRQLGIQEIHAITKRVSLSIGEDAIGEMDPPEPTEADSYTANAGELVWDFSVLDKNFVTVNTQRTKAVIGFTDTAIHDLDNVRIEIGTTVEDWATVALTMRNGSFNYPDGGGQILVVATGIVENTNMQWKDASKTSVGADWGTAPILAESVPAKLILPFNATRVQAWALDVTGQRTSALTVTPNGDDSEISIGGAVQSLWYELQIESLPGLEAIDYWTGNHFTEAQQLDALISGPLADPDKDGIPNLMEFLFGTNPWVKDTDSTYDLVVERDNGVATFVITFNVSKSYPEDKIQIGITNNLSAWTHHDLDSTELTITTNPLNSELNQVQVKYTPPSYPSFIQIKGSE